MVYDFNDVPPRGTFNLHLWHFPYSCPEINGHRTTRGQPPTQLLHTMLAMESGNKLARTRKLLYVGKLPKLDAIIHYLTFLLD